MDPPPWSRLLRPEPLPRTLAITLPTGRAVVFGAPAPERDGAGEDLAAVICVDDRRAVLAVADGAGGLPNGAQAAELALLAVSEAVLAGEPEKPLSSTLVDAFDEANRAVRAMGVGAGTTLVAVIVDGVEVRPFHAGDSQALVTGQRGKIRLETLSHSPTGYAVEAGLMDEQEALIHEERHLVSNLVGIDDMRIEIGPVVRIRPHDTLVLGSDGLFDNLAIGEISELVRRGPLDRAVEALASAATRRMSDPAESRPHKPDDLTCLLYRPNRPR